MKQESDRRQTAWEARYAAGHTGWDRGDVSPALTRWLDQGLVPPVRILVPGCGHGHEIVRLVESGCAVTAVDIATQPVDHLREQLVARGLAAEVIQADLLHWEPGAAFDAIYEQTCLCALEPVDWPAYERRLYRWLVPGGRLLALFMQTGRAGGPPFDCPMPDMRALFDRSRWEWGEEDAPLRFPHPNGLHEEGVVLARRAA